MKFREAIMYSLEHNYALLAMKHNLNATEKDIGIARSDMLPKFRVIEGFTATNNPTDALSLKLNQAVATEEDFSLRVINKPPSVTNFLSGGVIEQPLYNRKLMISVSMAKKEYSENSYIYLRKQEEIASQVAQACISIKATQDQIGVLSQCINDYQNYLKTAETKYKNKTGTYSDILRSQTALDEANEKLESNKKNLDILKRKLGLLLGNDKQIEISDTIPNIVLQDIDYYRKFSTYRNDLKALDVRVKSQKDNVKLAQADWYPTMTAASSYNFYNSNYPFGGTYSSYMAAAVLRWEVFDGNKRKYQISKAKEKELESKEYLNNLKLTVNYKVFEAYSNLETAKKNLSISDSELKAAEKNIKIISKNWENSKIPFVEVTDAQTDLDTARSNFVKYKNDVDTALINLLYESGTISQELMLNADSK